MMMMMMVMKMEVMIRIGDCISLAGSTQNGGSTEKKTFFYSVRVKYLINTTLKRGRCKQVLTVR